MAKPIRVDHSSHHSDSDGSFSRVSARGPSRTEQGIQGVVYGLIGLGLVFLGAFPGFLSAGFSYPLPSWVAFGGAAGFICCSIICFMGAGGAPLNSPIYKPLTIVQLISLGILFYWFVLGDSQLPFGGRLAAAIIIGFILVIFGFGAVVQFFFPNALEAMMRNKPDQ